MSESQRLKRGLTIALMLAAWFAISNHCLITTVGAEPVTNTEATEGCPFHSKQTSPAKPKPAPELPCCKILRAVVAKSVKPVAPRLLAPMNTLRSETELTVALWLLRPERATALDTGPPGARSFAELILQRNLPAHAPPRLA